MRFLKEGYHKTKHHHKNLLLLVLTSLLTPLLVFGIYSLFPPKVNASLTNPLQSLDKPFSAEVWGILDKSSISFETDPNIPVTVKMKSTNFPLKTLVEFEPKDLLAPNTSYTLKFSVENWFGLKSKKTLIRTTSSAPKVTKVSPDSGSIDLNSQTTLIFQLNQVLNKGQFELKTQPEAVFETTHSKNRILARPKTDLKQGQKYTYTLFLTSKVFDDINLFEGELTTLSPLEITSLEPADQAEVVLKNQVIKVSFNKGVDKLSFEKGFTLEPPTPLTLEWVDEKSVIIKPESLLISATKYSLILKDTISALDKSHLAIPVNNTFTTAGPVRVVSFSPTGAYPYLNTNIVVNFDQPVDELSAKAHFSIQPETTGNFSLSGNQIVFKPKSLAALTEYKIILSPGIVSLGGENSTETFTNVFTTTSEQTKVIGYSVQGKPITASYFGIGPKKILLIGAMHGSESNTGKMLTNWVGYLRANQGQIAKDRTFIIVPYANPDGTSKNQRFNAHGVDLNRNWDTPEWQSLTYLQNTSYPNGGGSAPFSEPETQALRNLILSENPSRIVSYHAAANMVIGDGIADSFGDWYAAQTGYNRVKGDVQEDPNMSALGYIITGTFEDWVTARGLVTLVIEFVSQTQNEYNRNLPALKGLLNYSI